VLARPEFLHHSYPEQGAPDRKIARGRSQIWPPRRIGRMLGLMWQKSPLEISSSGDRGNSGLCDLFDLSNV
jgi:hypothetical protein